ncbi:MAG: hypothetical protein CK429_31020 [Mycobacterium sp.]|uniref:DUF2510 domain-containing protein n=1 Tax=Mycobacterium sp. TaxID=1785 RepID=UPI000CBFB5CF|nr:DUF2510 domain-containing protein [Mycobacterium gordonae]MBX9978950.1 DUF2510 domain-containing protein [Mycobacterium gordonae]PJE05206.1 MAG: hypothetical protein CK429_31020 [Mycobacterium sp.]PJE06737.1 MAG: hypothetical protein CK428_23800 [Mycobacterium sp.]
MTVPTAPPAGWYVDPDGSAGQRYWDGERWTTHRRPKRPAPPAGVRRRWGALPVPLRVALVISLVVVLAGVGWALFTDSSRDDWAGLPNRLTCERRDGPKPPEGITVSGVEVKHPRSSVLQLTIRFAKPLPPSPTGTQSTKFVGYVLTYSVANNDGTGAKKFAQLGPEHGSDDLAITSTLAAEGNDSRVRPDRDTNARRVAPDTIQILLDLTRLGIDNQPVRPELTLDAQFDTPSTTTVRFATQVCTG